MIGNSPVKVSKETASRQCIKYSEGRSKQVEKSFGQEGKLELYLEDVYINYAKLNCFLSLNVHGMIKSTTHAYLLCKYVEHLRLGYCSAQSGLLPVVR